MSGIVGNGFMGRGKGDVGLPFIFTVTVGSGQSFQLPTVSNGTYDAIIEWGDTTSNALTVWNAAGRTHTYTTGGTYEIMISGVLIRWSVNNYADRLKITEIKQWGILKINAFGAFWGCTNITYTATDILDTSGVTSFAYWFFGNTSVTNIPGITSWVVSPGTNFGLTLSNSGMFSGCINFNQNLNDWDVSGAVNFRGMFFNCRSYNQPMNLWDMSSATTTGAMFAGCWIFNQDISGWNVSSVTSFNTGAFGGGMFSDARAFNQNISSWTVSGILSFDWMFQNAFAFNQNLSTWNFSATTTTYGMFFNATSFNQDISSWNTSSVNRMQQMFQGATSFNQNVGSLNVTALTNAIGMFTSVTLSTANYDALLIGWEAQAVQNNVPFSGGNSKYSAAVSAAATARAALIADHTWAITDGGPI